jgi:hypothetical protein
MITSEDWDAAEEEFMAAERERLGGPPTPVEVVAYARGELPEEAAARVRALLVYFPALTGILSERPPRKRTRHLLPLAAALFLAAFGALLWHSQRLTQELREPRIYGHRHQLLPMNWRGSARPSAYEVPHRESHLFSIAIPDEPRFPKYRLELLAVNGSPRTLWRGADIDLEPGDTIDLAVPGAMLGQGLYRIDLYGIRTNAQRLESYTIRVP